MHVEEVIPDGVRQKMRSSNEEESYKKESYEKEIAIMTAAGIRPPLFTAVDRSAQYLS